MNHFDRLAQSLALLVLAQSSMNCVGREGTEPFRGGIAAGSQCSLSDGGNAADAGAAGSADNSTVSSGGKSARPVGTAASAGNGAVSAQTENSGGASTSDTSRVATTATKPSCDGSPWVQLGSVPNVRQLGAIALAGGGTVVCDKLYRGSYLSSMTAASCNAFAALGIKTVLDIRSKSEQVSLPAACVSDVANVVLAPLPTPYNVSPADYLADLYTAPSIQAVVKVLADEASYPVYFHCLYGRDRTGVVAAVILLSLGASRESIMKDYELTAAAGFSISPNSLVAVLDEIEKIGGIYAYFEKVSVPREQVDKMRSILVRP